MLATTILATALLAASTTYSIIGIIVLILDIIAIISVLGSTKTVGMKVLWILVILLLPVIGMIIYFLVGK